MSLNTELLNKVKRARIFFFDIDGTIVKFKANTMSEPLRADLKELQRLGYKVYVASGRSPAMMENVSNFAFDGYMGLNGQYCVRGDYRSDHAEVLRSEALKRDDIHALIDYLESPESDESVMFVTSEGPFLNRVDQHADEVGEILNLKPWTIRNANEFRDVIIYQLLYFGTEENEHKIMNLLPNATSTRWHPSFIDIIPRDGGKHRGLEAICEAEGFTTEEAIAFGDGDNDLTMLEAAGIGIAMQNATPPVQAIADYITLSVDDEGVSHALRELGIIA